MVARTWHESQTKALMQAKHSKFPRNFERETEVHRRFAGHCSESKRRLTTAHRQRVGETRQ
jgi:hypothetical protein